MAGGRRGVVDGGGRRSGGGETWEVGRKKREVEAGGREEVKERVEEEERVGRMVRMDMGSVPQRSLHFFHFTFRGITAMDFNINMLDLHKDSTTVSTKASSIPNVKSESSRRLYEIKHHVMYTTSFSVALYVDRQTVDNASSDVSCLALRLEIFRGTSVAGWVYVSSFEGIGKLKIEGIGKQP
uniref:Uncharacterized protein n=1 Tax=Oryza nivara TaxID=4536 RepID=A0A0E0J3V7_ORYNI